MDNFKLDFKQIQVIQEVAKDCVLSLIKAATNHEGHISNFYLAYGLMEMIDTIVTSAEKSGDKGKTRNLLKDMTAKYFSGYKKFLHQISNLKPN